MHVRLQVNISIASQFVGMERIAYDENRKVGWGFFSRHLFNRLVDRDYALDKIYKEGDKFPSPRKSNE